MVCAECDWEIKACRLSMVKVSMLGTFLARDKIIPCSLNAIARVECSLSTELQKYLLLSLLYVKKKAKDKESLL